MKKKPVPLSRTLARMRLELFRAIKRHEMAERAEQERIALHMTCLYYAIQDVRDSK